MGWKNRGEPFVTSQGTAQRQSDRGRTRVRITHHGHAEPFFVSSDKLVDLAEFLDDLVDAAEDGDWDAFGGPGRG